VKTNKNSDMSNVKALKWWENLSDKAQNVFSKLYWGIDDSATLSTNQIRAIWDRETKTGNDMPDNK
jgi:hypothetical protein